MTQEFPPVSRRLLLQGSGALAAAAALSAVARTPATAQPTAAPPLTPGSPAAPDGASPALAPGAKPALKFRPDGRFKIVQFNDTQDDHLTDRRTIEFMSKVLDEEKPDFALINGDVITDGPTNATQVYQAINNVVLPMEIRKIPWAITFGNHDEDSAEKANTGVREPQMVEFIRQYKYNLNSAEDDGLYGQSNMRLIVSSATSDLPAFAIWMLDSGNYLKDDLGGQSTEEIPDYDYIRPQQIRWYEDLSKEMEQQAGAKVPGLMYFHIPTYEHRDMWFGGPGNTTLRQHHEAEKVHQIVGVKNEDCYVGAFNSGIYSAVLNRGDVLGIYCGHDHINSYMGNYFGVELGYCPGTGFGPYGLMDGTWFQHTLRGARVFELNENTDRVYESTRLVFAKNLGVGMNPKKQPLERPADFPAYVTPAGGAVAPAPGAGDKPDSSVPGSSMPGSSSTGSAVVGSSS